MTFYFGSPYSTPEGNSRSSWYGIGGTPYTTFDGDNVHSGGAASGSLFSWFHPTVLNQMATASPLLVDTTFDILGLDLAIHAEITVDLPVTTPLNKVYFFICHDGLHDQTNMVIGMLDTADLAITGVGETVTIERTYTLDPSVPMEDLNIIVLVQSAGTKEVLQADLAMANIAGTIVVDAEPDGLGAPWRLQGPGGLDFVGNGDRNQIVSLPGSYQLTWLDVDLWTKPLIANLSDYLEQDGTISFSGTYTHGPFDVLSTGPLGFDGSSQGAALVDFDGDGDLDLHVLNDGAADQLLRNDGDLVFTDVTAGLLADTGAGRSSAWADFNRDGFQDVYLARSGAENLLLAGDGAGGFTAATTTGAGDAGNAATVSWVDWNLDGNLDLFIMNRSQNNALLQSFGDLGGGFYVFAAQAGPFQDLSNGGAVAWTDFELDGRLDMYIVNQFAPNIILQNTSLGFSGLGSMGGLDDMNNGISAAWGDIDNDGDFDLYLANQGQEDRIFEIYDNGNSYTRLIGDNTKDNGQGRGVTYADFNLDGNLDIYLVRHNQVDQLLLGDGTGAFTAIPVGHGQASGPGQTVVRGDIDGDGDVDLFVTQDGAPNFLLVNNGTPGNHFFQVRLQGAANQPDAIGARVVITAGGVTQSRLITAGTGFMSQHSPVAEFGVAGNYQVDELQVFWPDGTTTVAGPFFTNQTLDVVYGESPVTDAEDTPLPQVTVLGQAYPNPFNPMTNIDFALAIGGRVTLGVYTVDGRFVRTLVSEDRAAGHHTANWNGLDQSGRPVASGTYFYRLQAPEGVSQTGRMVLLK